MNGIKFKKIVRSPLTGVILALCLSCRLCASGGNSGTTAAGFLKLDGSARAAAMGGAFAGVSGESSVVFYNPAGLANTDDTALSFTHNFMFEDIFCDWISFMHNTKYGEFGAGVQYLSYGNIKRISETDVDSGTMSPYDMALTLSHGRTIGDFSAGMNLKFVSSKIEDSAFAVCADFGGIYKMMNDDLSLGAVIQNLGTPMKFLDTSNPLPLNFRVGGQYNTDYNWTFAADLNIPAYGMVNACAGVEYNYDAGQNINILGRLGYATRTSLDGGLTGVTAGFGVKYNSYQFDYAFVPLGDLGLTHKIQIGMKID